MISPLILGIAILITFIILDTLNPLYSDIFILFYFLFAFVNIDGASSIATFYLFGLMFYFFVRIGRMGFRIRNEGFTKKLWGLQLKGNIPIVGLLIGVGIFILMRIIQGTVPGAIIGVPSLAISSAGFNISTIMLLGVVENRLFFTFFEFLRDSKLLFKIPFGNYLIPLGLFGPIVLTSLGFMAFHFSAYLLNFSSLIFSALVFSIWIASYILTKDDLPANVSHMCWNFSTAVQRILGVVL